MSRRRLGIIGLGLVGQAIAERMLLADWEVAGFDIATRQSELLGKLGGVPMESPSAVAAFAPRILFCLPDSKVVRLVSEQLRGEVPSGTAFIDTTTGSPDHTEQLALEWREAGVDYCDAPIVGSSEQIRQGTAMVLVGGSEYLFAIVESVARPWSSQIVHAGSIGHAARLKLVVNLALGLHRAVLAESLVLAEACGIDGALALRVLSIGPASSAVMERKGPMMLKDDFPPQARLRQHLKDVGLILAMGHQHNAELPLTDLHRTLLEKCVELGWGDLDNSAIIKLFRRSSGLAIP